MFELSPRHRGPVFSSAFRGVLPALVLVGFAESRAFAQATQPALLVSTGAALPATPGHPAIHQSTLVRVRPGDAPFDQFSEGHWQGVWGKVPGNVDAIANRPGVDPASHRALAFSLLSDEGGFEDGDVLGLAPGGGFEVIVAEADLRIALGDPSASIDLDGLAYDDAGRLLFSLQNDLANSIFGPVQDGDVLRVESDGSLTRAFVEADVQAAFTQATGSTAAIGDVLALEFRSGETWVGVQSPSSVDGGVLVLGPAARIEYAEADLGLDGAELDALLVLDPSAEVGRLRFSAHQAAPGDALAVSFDGGGAFHNVVVVMAGNSGYLETRGVGTGFGGLFVDPSDPWLNSFGVVPIAKLSANGSLTGTLELPPGVAGGSGFAGEDGWTFQIVDALTLEVSAPYRVTL